MRNATAIGPRWQLHCYAKVRPIGAILIRRMEVRPFSTSRSHCSNTLPLRPSSPSRTRGCSTSCAAHDDLRVAGAADGDLGGVASHQQSRPANWSRCSMRCWRTQRAFARPSLAYCSCARATRSARLPLLTTRHRRMLRCDKRGALSAAPGGWPWSASCSTKQMVHIADHAIVRGRHPLSPPLVELGGARTILGVPMLKENELVGAISDLPPGGPAVHRQADRAGAEFCRASRHRHRECAAAQ